MSTKKLGRVMWTHSHCGDDIVLRSTNPSGQRSPALLIDLSDPAALVEKVAKAAAECALSEVGIEGYSDDECKALTEKLSPVIAKRLGVPAKLLKERKKK